MRTLESGHYRRSARQIDLGAAAAGSDAKPAAAFRELRVEAPNWGLREFHSADASCAPAARARPSTD